MEVLIQTAADPKSVNPSASAPPPPTYEQAIRKPDTETEDHKWHDSEASKLHSLIAAAYYNKTLSPLCSLPDEVLVRLLQLADRITVECLRRASRTFLRLFHVACLTTPPKKFVTCRQGQNARQQRV